MNIFYLDNSPKTAAEYHCDKHVVKMILETAQILSTALYKNGVIKSNRLYRPTHSNHPCVVWAADNQMNYMWLCYLGLFLGNQYTLRFGKIHKSIEVIKYCKQLAYILEEGQFTDPPQCMPEKYQQPDTIEAYRDYYLNEKNFGYSVTVPKFMQP